MWKTASEILVLKQRNANADNESDMVKCVPEVFTYCSPGTSSGEQKKNGSASQLPFRSQNSPATIEADQILLTLQKLVNNNNSAKFHSNIHRISKLPKSLATTMPRLTGKKKGLCYLMTSSEQASKSTFTGLRMTES